jgi:hypothetical protein
MLAQGPHLTKKRELCCAVLAGCSKWPDFSPAQPLAVTAPAHPESAKTASSPRDAPCPMQGHKRAITYY